MVTVPDPIPHKDRAKKSPATLLEVARWVYLALNRERGSGLGEFLTPALMDFRGVAAVIGDKDIPNDDPLCVTISIRLHSEQEFRVIIEEK